jgi:hypothetical protein
MRIPVALAAAGMLLVAGPFTAAAQRTGDRPQLIFTISGGYIAEEGLWSVPSQPIFFENTATNLALTRSISPTIAGALAVTYYPKDKLGFTAEAFFTSLGLDDSCRVISGGSPTITEACQDIDTQAKSAASVAVSVGGMFRLSSREFISPFVRASAGLLFTNQSSLMTQGVSRSNDFALVRVYDDDNQTRVRPSLNLGVGATVAMSRGYHLRVEVRDNIAGIEGVAGATSQFGQVPPHETVYKHLFGVMIGLDVVLERRRGRRY